MASKAMQLFIEAKASRDIIVHAQRKAGQFARAKVGDLLPIDDHYFKSVIGTIKDVYASIYDAVISEYGDDDHERTLKMREHARRIAPKPPQTASQTTWYHGASDRLRASL